jgi:amino acid transporter
MYLLNANNYCLQTYTDRFLKALLFGTTKIAVDSIFIVGKTSGNFSPDYKPLKVKYSRFLLRMSTACELIYYLLVPLAAGWLLFRDKPRDYGIRIGRWKSSIILAVVCLAAMVLRSFLPCFIIHFGIYVMMFFFTNS